MPVTDMQKQEFNRLATQWEKTNGSAWKHVSGVGYFITQTRLRLERNMINRGGMDYVIEELKNEALKKAEKVAK